MLSDHVPRLILVLVLLFLSGFFSGSETALFSLDAVQRKRIGMGESSVDRALRWLLSQPRRLIATLLVGNELVNISISTVVAGLTHDVAAAGSALEQTLWSMAVVVPLVLLLGEVTPKTIAIKAPEAWARVVARPLRLFSGAITPLRWAVRSFADAVINLLGGQPPPRERPLREDEFLALVEQGSAKGELEDEERDIIENVFEFGDRTVGDIMTPADRVFALSVDEPLDRIVDEIVAHGFSRVPLFQGTKNHIVGTLYAKDLVGYGVTLDLAGKHVADLLREPFFVPKTTKCSRLFREFRERRTHMAVVVDEYGSMIGLVTMQDLLDELFGELRDEDSQVLDLGTVGDSGARLVRDGGDNGADGGDNGADGGDDGADGGGPNGRHR